MATAFNYISSGTQNGITKLKALEYAWADDSSQLSVGVSDGVMSGAVQELAASLRSLDNDVASLISSTIAYLQKVDQQFNNVDETAAAALLASAQAAAAMRNVFDIGVAHASAGIQKKTNKEKRFPTIGQFLLGGFSIKGAVGQAEAKGEGSLLGFKTSGSVSGKVLEGSVKTKSGAEWDLKKGNAGLEAGIEAEGKLASGKAEGSIGVASGSVEASIGVAAVSGSVGASLYKDGKLAPSIGAKAKASATGIEGKATAQVGKDDMNLHAAAKGAVGKAEAKAEAQAGVIVIEDETTGEKKRAFGASASAGAEAYVAEGKVSGGITIFGIKVDAEASGKAGGAGVKAGGSVTTGGVSGEIGAGLGLGAGLKIKVDWSEFKWPWQ